MRTKKLCITLCTVLMLVCFAIAGGAVAFAEGEDTIIVKSLVSTGSMTVGEVEWAESGAPDSWPGAIEEFKDDEQEDGGDIILRTELDTAGTSLVSGQFGFSRQSTNAAKAAYPVSGFTMKFYASASPSYMLLFTQNSGWYNGSTYHWSLWFQGDSVTLRYSVEGGDNFISAGSHSMTYYHDYDYFSDPQTQGYANVGDTSKTFVGTQNILEIKPISGSLWVVLNGEQLFNLTETGIVSEVIDNANSEGMFLSFYGTATQPEALKITDIYNVQSSWTAGVPETYTSTNPAAVEYMSNASGNTQFRSTESNGYAFDITYKTEQYFSDMTVTFYLDGNSLAENDSLSLVLQGGEEQSPLKLTFTKKTINSAGLTIMQDEQELYSGDVSLYFNGTALNTINIKETVPVVVTVNGTAAYSATDELQDFKDSLTEGKVTVGYEIDGSAVSILTPVAYTSQQVEIFDSAEGFTVEGENVIIKSDGDYMMFYNENAGSYTVTYTENKLMADSFVISYKLGKFEGNIGGFRINVEDGDAKLSFAVAPASSADKAQLSLYLGDSSAPVASGEIDYNWAYESGEHSLGFACDGGYSYLIYLDGALVLMIDGSDEIAAIDEEVSAFENKLGTASFELVDDAYTAFAWCDYEYYVRRSTAGGWGEGAIPSMSFGYDADDNSVLAFENSYSYIKSTEVLVDGFSMTFKTYSKENGASPQWAISNSTAWYSNNSAIMFSIDKTGDTTAKFNILYTNKLAGDFEFIGTADENVTIDSFAVESWNWNNGIENTITLAKNSDGLWRWTVNGQVLTPAEDSETDYSDYLEEVYSTFTSANKTGVVQIYGGTRTVWNISSMSEYVANVDPVASQPSLKDSYAIGEKIEITLSDVFSDANGDTLNYVMGDGCEYGTISGGVWTFSPSAAGEYEIVIEAYDGRGGQATLTFTVTVAAAQDGGNTESGGGCSSAAGAAGGLIAAAAIVTAGCLLLRKKADKNSK